MTAEAPTIYRSNHPDVWAAVRAYQADHKRFTAEVFAFARKWDMSDHTPQAVSGFGDAEKLAGFDAGDTWRNPPAGWRYIAKGHFLIPYRNKAKGNLEMAAEYDAIKPVRDYRYEWPGMPSFTGMFRAPGCHGDADEVWLYADWGDDKPGPDPEQVDLTYWEPMKRSAYYALKESGAFNEAETAGATA